MRSYQAGPGERAVTPSRRAPSRRAPRATTTALAAAVLACAVSVSADARADDITAIGAQLRELQTEANNLAQGIQRPAQMGNQDRDRAQRRLIDAEVAFGIGNFDDAAVMLYDYVEKNPTSPAYDEAMYYLAESLFQKGDNVASRTYFAKLAIDIGSRSKFYQQSLERLIELSLKLSDGAEVDKWLQALDAVPPGERRPSVPYVRGKYAYFKDRYDEALIHFSNVRPKTEYYFQAQYFTGACHVAKGDLPAAAQVYDKLIKRAPKNTDDKRVIELSHMALGRLHYERDQPSKAIDQYLEINRRSDLFDEALYEVAWVYVKNDQYDKALRALELLALSDPSSSKMPDVRILEANLRIRRAQAMADKIEGNNQEEYGKATQIFETTHETFEKPHAELAQIIARQSDPRAFMSQITGRQSDAFDVNSTMPEVAAAWIREQPEVGRVMNIEADLGQIGSEIEEAERTIERLEAALGSPSRANIYPSLAKKRTRATEILEELFDLRARLVTYELGLVNKYATASQKAEIQRLGRQRRDIAISLERLPDAEVKYGERIERARGEYVKLDQRAAEVSTVIDVTEATLVALEKYLQDQIAEGAKPADLEQYATAIRELRAEVNAMGKELASIRREATLAKDEAGTGDEIAMHAKGLRARLRRALDTEARALARVIPRMQGADRQNADRSHALIVMSDGIARRLDGVHTTIDDIVEYALAEVRQALVEEKGHLAAYKREFVTYEAESRDLGGVILGESFVQVKEKFYDVLVRSDIGIIDVTWSQKEELDETSQRLGLDKLRELRTLQDEFRDILEEEAAAGADGGSK